MKKVVFTLDEYEAKELADYLSGADMHLSVGDRHLLALQIYSALEE